MKFIQTMNELLYVEPDDVPYDPGVIDVMLRLLVFLVLIIWYMIKGPVVILGIFEFIKMLREFIKMLREETIKT